MTKKYNILHDDTTTLFLTLIICGIGKADSRHDKFLMREIMLSDNFGKQDARFESTKDGYNLPHLRDQSKRLFMQTSCYPSETLCSPQFKIWHNI